MLGQGQNKGQKRSKEALEPDSLKYGLGSAQMPRNLGKIGKTKTTEKPRILRDMRAAPPPPPPPPCPSKSLIFQFFRFFSFLADAGFCQKTPQIPVFSDNTLVLGGGHHIYILLFVCVCICKYICACIYVDCTY